MIQFETDEKPEKKLQTRLKKGRTQVTLEVSLDGVVWQEVVSLKADGTLRPWSWSENKAKEYGLQLCSGSSRILCDLST